jgi:hypothetical protein
VTAGLPIAFSCKMNIASGCNRLEVRVDTCPNQGRGLAPLYTMRKASEASASSLITAIQYNTCVLWSFPLLSTILMGQGLFRHGACNSVAHGGSDKCYDSDWRHLQS